MKFPSPIGVIFFLILEVTEVSPSVQVLKVSVSYRSYILSYHPYAFRSPAYYPAFPSPIGVIFFLINSKIGIYNIIYFISCFRLLSELYSFLWEQNSFFDQSKANNGFPSPIGVIFFLINSPFEFVLFIPCLVSVSYRSYILSYKILTLYQQ
mgnify:CR=1 FL=1